MRRNGRASLSWTRGRGSSARPRSRSHALRFREGNRRAGAFRPVRLPLPETADDRSPLAFFAGDSRVSAPLQRKPFALPRHLSKIQTARRPRDGRLHLDRAGARRKDARHSDFHSRIQRDSRQGEPAHRANGARGSAGVQGMRAVFSQSAHGSHRHADSEGAPAA